MGTKSFELFYAEQLYVIKEVGAGSLTVLPAELWRAD